MIKERKKEGRNGGKKVVNKKKGKGRRSQVGHLLSCSPSAQSLLRGWVM